LASYFIIVKNEPLLDIDVGDLSNNDSQVQSDVPQMIINIGQKTESHEEP
jgi:hypothetical protein